VHAKFTGRSRGLAEALVTDGEMALRRAEVFWSGFLEVATHWCPDWRVELSCMDGTVFLHAKDAKDAKESKGKQRKAKESKGKQRLWVELI
jgi:hypothetical protein